MKKIYINPTTNVVKVNVAHHMMTGSETMGINGNYNSDNVTIGSRRGRNTYWEDDEE
jgi:hypothetical protein